METNQVDTMTVSFYIFTFHHGFMHFHCIFYKDSFYECIAMFSTEEK